MSIIVDKHTKLLIQGITGYQGRYQSKAMMEFGTKVVAGVRFGKGGEKINDIPVFNTVSEAVDATGANTSCIFVPAPSCKDAALEAIDAGLHTIVIVTEHLPVLDAIQVVSVAKAKGITLIGPNCRGMGPRQGQRSGPGPL